MAYDADSHPVGEAFKILNSAFSKTALLKWCFALLKAGLPPKGSVVVKTFTSTTPALSAGGGYTKTLAESIQPLVIVGKIPTRKGGKTASVLSPQTIDVPIGVCTYHMSGASQTSTSSYGTSRIYWENRRDGVTNPLWESQVRKGINATTPMTATRGQVSYYPGYMELELQPHPGAYDVIGVAGFLIATTKPIEHYSGSLTAKCDSQALSKLHDKLYAIQHDADIGETLGEYKQALSMIGKPLQGLHDLVDLYHRRAAVIAANVQRRYGRSLSRLDPHMVRDLNAALGALYLEFTFGWKPLAHDLIGVIKAMQEKRGTVATHISVSYKGDTLVSDTTSRNILNNHLVFNVRTVKSVKATVRYQIGIEPTKVEALSYAERIGFVPERFVPTLYAVLPYSWLLDYFTGINIALDALCDDFKFTTWVCKTERVESITEVVSNPDYSATRARVGVDYKSVSGSPAVSRAVRTDVRRSIPTSLIPAVTLTVPTSWRPWANVVALAAQKKLRQMGNLSAAGLSASGLNPDSVVNLYRNTGITYSP